VGMSPTDEPALDPARGVDEEAEDLGAKILDLVTREPFAVLCTQGESQPYGSVVAVAFSEDLRHVFFATPITTRKYRLLRGNDKVALVVDDRSAWPHDMMKIQAVTLTGRAVHVEDPAEFARGAPILVRRHPQLESFVHAETSALFQIEVLRYFHVERFQEVREWAPPSS
jgi:nitroimidazol reductase NimA-like FMN-containing flavoprotein (pyridoxamine 5'-phosphate oxidase superfamily)